MASSRRKERRVENRKTINRPSQSVRVRPTVVRARAEAKGRRRQLRSHLRLDRASEGHWPACLLACLRLSNKNIGLAFPPQHWHRWQPTLSGLSFSLSGLDYIGRLRLSMAFQSSYMFPSFLVVLTLGFNNPGVDESSLTFENKLNTLVARKLNNAMIARDVPCSFV